MGFRHRQQFDFGGIAAGLMARFGHSRPDARYPRHEFLV
jgi:hypothetical protein